METWISYLQDSLMNPVGWLTSAGERAKRRGRLATMDALGIAFHESAHFVGFSSQGVRCSELTASNRDGACGFPAGTARELWLLPSLAGALAAIRSGFADFSSREDDAAFRAACDERGIPNSPRERQRLREEVKRFLNLHWNKITFLADRLHRAGRLSASALTQLCNEPGSPLACYRGLYSAAPPVPRGRSSYLKDPTFTARPSASEYRGDVVKLPDGQVLRWSAETGTYLGPLRPIKGIVRVSTSCGFL